MIKWPWTNLHELNLDWIIQKMKELEEKVTGYAKNVTASAVTGAPGSAAAATVTGDLEEGVNFTFTIPRGATGATGAKGDKGDPGQGIVYYATCTTGSSVEVKDAVSDGDEIFLNVGDVVAVKFSEGNIHYSPSLHVDDNGTYPIYGWKNTSGDVEGSPLIDRNVTVLFRYDGFAFNIIGGPVSAAVTDGVPKSGLLSALQASRLNFGYQEIPANTTTAVHISLTKNGAQPFVNVCAWAMTARTYELLKPGTDYEASMNIMATGSTTLTFRLLSSRDYPVYVVVTGNAAVH